MITTTKPPELVGYRAAHKRVSTERGPAWAESCQDCGHGADEWSYDHSDRDELEAGDSANLGAPYSLSPERYQARCKACHVRFDKAAARERQGIVDDSPALTMFEDDEAPQGISPIEVSWYFRKFYREESRGLPDEPLSDVRDLLGAFITAQNPADLDMITLWIAGTHLAARGVSNTIPRLAIVAPSYGAGKSTALDFVRRLSHKGETVTSNVSDALIPRILQSEGFTTLCIDEADRVIKPENAGTMAVLNAGWQRGATARINQPSSDGGWTPSKIDVFSPVAMAGNGLRIAADVRERTLTVRLIKSAGVAEARWNEGLQGVDDRLRGRLSAWADRASRDVRVKRPRVPDGLAGRDRDRWSLLLSAGRGTGGSWVTKAEALAVADRDARAAEAAAVGVAPNHQLAFDLFKVWRQGELAVGTRDLADRLIVENPEVWGAPSGKLLTPTSLGWRLSQFYGVSPQQRGRVRGFSLADVRRVWQAVSIPYDPDPEDR